MQGIGGRQKNLTFSLSWAGQNGEPKQREGRGWGGGGGGLILLQILVL